MAKLILKCPYIKGGTKKKSAHLSNMVKYVATRDGVEKIQVLCPLGEWKGVSGGN